MKRLAREPLLHFLVLGTLLFCAFRLLSTPNPKAPKRIVVTRERQADFTNRFAITWGRPPSPAELQQLIDDYVRQEIFCREAMALGFDHDDPVIRSQLVQNIQVVPDELAAQKQPTDGELKAFMNAHPDLFAVGRQFTFRQVYLNPEYHRESLPADAAKLKAELNQAGERADLAKFGDPYALPHDFTNASSSDLAGRLGEAFTAELDKLPLNQWQGPIPSAYGEHLVLIRSRTEGQMPSLEDERGYVRKEWMEAQRGLKREAFYESLRKQYAVTVEPPGTASRTGTAAKTP